MTAGLFIAATIIVGLAVFMREGLILAGLLKGPILRGYERYGDEEPFYYPLPRLLLALAVIATGVGLWAQFYSRSFCLPLGPAFGLYLAAYVANDRRDLARQHPALFLALPRWTHVLREYTTREERRRIAYYWLDLPARTRLLFNSSDRAFLTWADLIVLATVSGGDDVAGTRREDVYARLD